MLKHVLTKVLLHAKSHTVHSDLIENGPSAAVFGARNNYTTLRQDMSPTHHARHIL